MKFNELNYLTCPFKVGKKVKESHISWHGKKEYALLILILILEQLYILQISFMLNGSQE